MFSGMFKKSSKPLGARTQSQVRVVHLTVTYVALLADDDNNR